MKSSRFSNGKGEGGRKGEEGRERGRNILHSNLSCGYRLAQITVTLIFSLVGVGKRHPIIPSS